MAWRERNLFQKFDLLFPYRNLVTSILFFSLSSRYDFNSHFPSHRNFLYKLHPSRSTQPPIFNFLFITTDPENRFSTPWVANSHGRKEKKNVYATHRTPFPSSRDSILKRNVIEPFSNSPSSPPLNKFSPARDTTADSS